MIIWIYLAHIAVKPNQYTFDAVGPNNSHTLFHSYFPYVYACVPKMQLK